MKLKKLIQKGIYSDSDRQKLLNVVNQQNEDAKTIRQIKPKPSNTGNRS
jgi:hypothetical protein